MTFWAYIEFLLSFVESASYLFLIKSKMFDNDDDDHDDDYGDGVTVVEQFWQFY